MIKKSLYRATFAGCLFLLGSIPVWGQATLSVASSSATAADIGVAELTGQITLTVIAGTTVEGPLSVQYSSSITNNSAQEILLGGTGAFSTVALSAALNTDSNSITFTVPAGGAVGDQIRISGVRVSTAGLQTGTVTAVITSLTPGANAIAAGQNRVIVIDRVLPPFSVDLSASGRISIVHGLPATPGASFFVREGYPSAFSDSVGSYGQTVPTRLRIHPFPSIPPGVRLNFQAIAGSGETLAVLMTSSGVAESVPRGDGSTDVIYQFVSDPSSFATLETFQIFVNVEVGSASKDGTVTFQVRLEPIGIAKPNDRFPSTDIPRYSERFVPDETDLLTGTVELAFPFGSKADALYTGIAVTNPLEFRVRAVLTAYDKNGLVISGTGIINPVPLVLPRKGQYAKLASEIFGAGFNAATAGTVRLVGNTSVLAGFYLQGREAGPGLDGATAEVNPKSRFLLPDIARQGPLATTTIQLFNPGNLKAHATLRLLDSNGHEISSASQDVDPGGTVSRAIGDLFAGVSPSSFSGGYLQGSADFPLVARETFGNALDFNVLEGQTPVQQVRFYIPHFASGLGYETDLNLINLDATITASVTLTAMDENGIPLAIAGNPTAFTIPAGTQVIRDLRDLFPALGSGLQTGYIRADVEPIAVAYFTSVPPLGGSVRFSAAGGVGSSALPLNIPAATDFVYAHVAQSPDYYTGLAILNLNPTPVTVTISVLSKDGTPVGTLSTLLQPGQRISKLLYELVPASKGQVGGYVRVTSNLPVSSFSLFGSNDGLSVSAIPPQDLGK